MPVICVNPSNSSEKEIVEKLSLQNGDLRVFLSDQLEETFNKSIPGKKIKSVEVLVKLED